MIEYSDMEQTTTKRKYLPAYQLRMGSEHQGSYEDLRDAIAAGKLLRSDYQSGSIRIIDLTSGFLVIDID